MERVIFCVDFKSFYASCECVDRGLNPLSTKLVVADKSRGSGTIVLAVSPYLKTFGVPSRLRVFELPPMNDIIYAKPRMERYLEISSRVISIFLHYVNEDDLHVYSIDESFLDLTSYIHALKMNPYELALKIKKDIYDQLGLIVTIGGGENLFMAKTAMDTEAKKTADGIAIWEKKDISGKLQKIYPLHKVWSIGSRMERKLNRIGLYTLGDIANTSKQYMMKQFGIIGGELFDHANGIDTSCIRERYVSHEHSLSIGQVLMKDYFKEEMPVVIREMCDDVLMRLRQEKSSTRTIGLSIGYSKDISGGFSRQNSFDIGETDSDFIYQTLMKIFNENVSDFPIRTVGIRLSQLAPVRYAFPNLFEDGKEKEKRQRLDCTLDAIKARFGLNSVCRMDALRNYSTALANHNKIGGHAR